MTYLTGTFKKNNSHVSVVPCLPWGWSGLDETMRALPCCVSWLGRVPAKKSALFCVCVRNLNLEFILLTVITKLHPPTQPLSVIISIFWSPSICFIFKNSADWVKKKAATYWEPPGDPNNIAMVNNINNTNNHNRNNACSWRFYYVLIALHGLSQEPLATILGSRSYYFSTLLLRNWEFRVIWLLSNVPKSHN